LAFTFLVLAGPGQAAPPQVEEGEDLHADAQRAARQALPILLAFAADYCEYCTQLEEWFLVPMLISGDYEDKILIRKVRIDSSRRLVDFDGAATDSDQLASRYGVQMVPTLVFVDARGQELTERMVGLTTLDFYGGYLEQRIDAAVGRLRGAGAPH
jgi:thioredoxin-related protein